MRDRPAQSRAPTTRAHRRDEQQKQRRVRAGQVLLFARFYSTDSAYWKLQWLEAIHKSPAGNLGPATPHPDLLQRENERLAPVAPRKAPSDFLSLGERIEVRGLFQQSSESKRSCETDGVAAPRIRAFVLVSLDAGEVVIRGRGETSVDCIARTYRNIERILRRDTVVQQLIR